MAAHRASTGRRIVTRERHATIKRVFLEACALEPEKRPEFLSLMCAGDGDLLREVNLLLANHVPQTESKVAPGGGQASSATTNNASELPSYETGQVVSDRYRIVSLLGVGGMGEVYRAEDLKLGQTVALKFLPADLASNMMLRRRFEMEVKFAREITHPNVCRVHDLGEDKGCVFISMEYVDGENLSAMLKRTGRLSEARVVEIAQELCFGLNAAHTRGVLHRDLKPANVMLDNRGRVRITDFGLAGLVGHIHPSEIRSGTPRYMAPEQLAGKGVSEKSDIYSLGLILYELISGRPAFDGQSADTLLHQHRETTPVAPSQFVRDIDPSMEAIILACLERDPSARPESALAIAAALPGSDLLAAALAAGEVPSPAMLSVAGSGQAIFRPAMMGAMAGCIVLLALALVAARKVHPVLLRDTAMAPDVLESAGRRLISDAGFIAEPRDLVSRYAARSEYSLAERGATEKLELGAMPSDSPLFFLRASFGDRIESQNPLSPFVSSAGGIFSVDQKQADTILIAFEPDGRLALFDASMIASEAQPEINSPAWGDWVGRAGMKWSEFRAAKTILSSLSCETQRIGLGPNSGSGLPASTHVEGAARGDVLDYFAVMTGAPQARAHLGLDVVQRRNLITASRNVLFLLLIIVSIPAAWTSWRQGGSDAGGAIRIGIFVGFLRLCANVLTARHVPMLPEEISIITPGVFNSIAEGLMVAIFYLAMERYVRQVWPQTLAGWSRILRGRIRDPHVGRDILVGCVVGPLWAALGSFEYVLPEWLGLTPRASLRFMDEFQYLMGARFGAAFCCDWLINAIYLGLLLLLLLVIMRVVVRRERIAASITWLIISLMYVPTGRHLLTGWLVIGLGGIAVSIHILVRYGLVSFVVASFLNKLIMSFPFTPDLHAWYSGYGMFAVAVTLGVACFGFIQASKPTRQASLPVIH
jgi:predicted Ser/Thr protein kinase